MTQPWSTCLHLLSVPSGLAWKRLSSLQIIPLFLFTVMWLFVMPLTPNALKDVHQAEEEDARRVPTWLMSTLWLRAQFSWCSKKERKNSQVAWIWGVCILINDQYVLLSVCKTNNSSRWPNFEQIIILQPWLILIYLSYFAIVLRSDVYVRLKLEWFNFNWNNAFLKSIPFSGI